MGRAIANLQRDYEDSHCARLSEQLQKGSTTLKQMAGGRSRPGVAVCAENWRESGLEAFPGESRKRGRSRSSSNRPDGGS